MTTVSITKDIGFDTGHRVPNHESKCRNLHGHRYQLFVTCEGEIIEEEGSPDEGMLVDFSHLKALMISEVSDPLDHGFIYFKGDDLVAAMAGLRSKYLEDQMLFIEFPYIPTAENIARWIWDQLEEPIAKWFKGNLRLSEVKLFETPTSSATYTGG